MKILVAIKRTIDYAVPVRVKADKVRSKAVAVRQHSLSTRTLALRCPVDLAQI